MDVNYLILKLNESKKIKMQFVIALNVLRMLLMVLFAKSAIISIIANIIQYFN